MKKSFAVTVSLMLITFLSAQECRLQPAKFIYHWNEPVNIRWLSEKNIEEEYRNDNWSPVPKLEIYFSGAKDDLSGWLAGKTGDFMQFKVLDEGTVMVTVHAGNYFREQEAAEPYEYPEATGLQNTTDYPCPQNQTDSTRREFYQLCLKTIFQIGKKYNNTYRQETSLPLDIIPLQNPYQLKNKDSLLVKILFYKKPLAHQPVQLWRQSENLSTREDFFTDENGLVHFPVEIKGTWLISTEKKMPLENNNAADCLSYQASFTWGYE